MVPAELREPHRTPRVTPSAKVLRSSAGDFAGVGFASREPVVADRRGRHDLLGMLRARITVAAGVTSHLRGGCTSNGLAVEWRGVAERGLGCLRTTSGA